MGRVTSDGHLACFKAYDVRGQVPDELDEQMAELIGRAYAELVKARRVAVGHDIRLTSPALTAALVRGLTAWGVDVVDIGRVGTEQTYFATFALDLDGGIMVTASHNPRDYNGMKFTRAGARPISADTGLMDIEGMVAVALGVRPGENRIATPPDGARAGRVEKRDISPEYVEHLLTYVDAGAFKPLHIVTNAGNGGAGVVLDLLEPRLPIRMTKLNNDPDGNFPHGVPNPLLPDNRAVTAEAVKREKADLGLAWDGDFDRCFFFDERGDFIDGYYVVGLLAQVALRRHPGSSIIHDPRLIWNTIELVTEAGGIPVASKSGHAFIKEKMREVNASYGGEMSAHHYFREFSYADSGMISWLEIVDLISHTGRTLGQLVEERMERFPISGELNRTLSDPTAALAKLEKTYGEGALSIDRMDGVSIEYERWRFNLRASNTEPVVRLNIETRGDKQLLAEKTEELLGFLDAFA
jgi:phosphomannomutase